MRIEVEEVTIKLSGSECCEIGMSIFNDLKASIERHYNHLQQDKDGEPVFRDLCAKQINMMNDFLTISGYHNMVEHFNNEFEKMFAERRKERRVKATQ